MNNYSFETSLPPYQEWPSEKKRQADNILFFIKCGADTLLELSELSGLPQSTVSGRCNDLITEKRIEYKGYTVFRDRKRKKICLVKAPVIGIQQPLF